MTMGAKGASLLLALGAVACIALAAVVLFDALHTSLLPELAWQLPLKLPAVIVLGCFHWVSRQLYLNN